MSSEVRKENEILCTEAGIDLEMFMFRSMTIIYLRRHSL